MSGAAKAKMEEKMLHFETLTQTKLQEAKKKKGWVVGPVSPPLLFKHYKNRKQRRKHLTGGRGGKRFIRPRKKD